MPEDLPLRYNLHCCNCGKFIAEAVSSGETRISMRCSRSACRVWSLFVLRDGTQTARRLSNFVRTLDNRSNAG